MSKTMTRWLVAAAIAVAVPSFASAAPVSGALAIKNAAASNLTGNVETVRYWGGGWRGGYGGWRGGWGWRGGGCWGCGFGAGVAIGGLLAAPYYYGGYYGGGPYYADPYYAEPGYYQGGGGYYQGGGGPYYQGGGGGGGGVEYCMRRYRTYNPNTGTFIGNDGRPHPCP